MWAGATPEAMFVFFPPGDGTIALIDPNKGRVLARLRVTSEMSESGFSGVSRAVGWNWTNSMSAKPAPASHARTIPSPVAPAGFVVAANNAPTPPVASTVELACT